MGYIEDHLITGEKIVLVARRHWIVFAWPAVFFFTALLGLASQSIEFGGLFSLLATAASVPSFIDYATSEFGVTNRRVLIKVGFIRRHSLEILLTKVEGVSIDQGVIGRVFDYGTIAITGAGGTRGSFEKITAPFEFRSLVQEQVVAAQAHQREPAG